MRTDGFGVRCDSSTSGVRPTRSSRLPATALRTPLPDVDRRTELAEELVDAPDEPGERGVDRGVPVERGELVAPALQPADLQQVGARIPRAVLDHPLAPLGADRVDRAEPEARSLGGGLEAFGAEAVRREGGDGRQLRLLARLEPVGRDGDVREDRAARPE